MDCNRTITPFVCRVRLSLRVFSSLKWRELRINLTLNVNIFSFIVRLYLDKNRAPPPPPPPTFWVNTFLRRLF